MAWRALGKHDAGTAAGRRERNARRIPPRPCVTHEDATSLRLHCPPPPSRRWSFTFWPLISPLMHPRWTRLLAHPSFCDLGHIWTAAGAAGPSETLWLGI